MEVPRLGVESKRQLQACTAATAMWNLSCICDLHHSSRQHWILNSLSKARDRTCILIDTGQVHYCWAVTGTPASCVYIHFFFYAVIFFCIKTMPLFCLFKFLLPTSNKTYYFFFSKSCLVSSWTCLPIFLGTVRLLYSEFDVVAWII